jgi:hypothetical protein
VPLSVGILTGDILYFIWFVVKPKLPKSTFLVAPVYGTASMSVRTCAAVLLLKTPLAFAVTKSPVLLFSVLILAVPFTSNLLVGDKVFIPTSVPLSNI